MNDTYEINNVEIFAVGTWNGDSYTVQDLDQVVSAFVETKDHLKPYLKLGHSDKQTLLAEDELPAAGWISNLKRVGEKLVADFSGIPKKIYEIIRNGGYKRISSELFINAKVAGKVYEKVLKAVALLGGATPAVHNLNDLLALYAMPDVLGQYKITAFKFDELEATRAFELDTEIVKEEDFMIEKRGEKWCLVSKSTGSTLGCHSSREEAVKQEQAIKASQSSSQKGVIKKMTEEEAKKLQEENKALKSENEILKQENTDLTKKFTDLFKQKRNMEIDQKIKKLVSEKKILPAQEKYLFTILSGIGETTEKKFSVGEKEYNSVEEVIFELLAQGGNVGLPTEPSSKKGKRYTSEDDGEERDDDGNIVSGQEKDRKIKEYAQKNSVSYKEAAFKLHEMGEIESL